MIFTRRHLENGMTKGTLGEQLLSISSDKVSVSNVLEEQSHTCVCICTYELHASMVGYLCIVMRFIIKEPLLWFRGRAVSSGRRLETQEIWWLCCLQTLETPRGQWANFDTRAEGIQLPKRNQFSLSCHFV